MKKYYNTPCSIYRFVTQTVRGSLVSEKTPIYEDIKCAIRKKREDYDQTAQAIQTDRTEYTMNLDSQYTGIVIGDIVIINNKEYKVINDPIPHERFNGKIDNFEIYIDTTTESNTTP